MSTEIEFKVNEYIKKKIQIIKENSFNFNNVIEPLDYESIESIEQIEHSIQLDRSIINNFFQKEYPNYKKDDRIILLTFILLDLIFFFDDISEEEICTNFGYLKAKDVSNKLGFEFDQTYQNGDLFIDPEINLSDKPLLKLGSFGIEIILELIKYDFKCELKDELIGRIMWKLKKFDDTYRQQININILSFFKSYDPIIPILAQQGYLDLLNEEDLEEFTNNLPKIINFETFDQHRQNISLLLIVRTRLKKLNLLNRKNNMESLVKGIWKIIKEGDEYDLKSILINFLEYLKLPRFQDFINENQEKHNLEKFLNAFVLIYIKCESPDDWINFFKKYYKFFLNMYQLMPTNFKKKTQDILLINLDPLHDWELLKKLVSDRILPEIMI